MPNVSAQASPPRLCAFLTKSLRIFLFGCAGITLVGLPCTYAAEPAKPSADHWAFRPIADPPVPDVRQEGWESPIDRFLLAKMREKNLSPAPPASKSALLRRVYFDLIGLPPSPEAQARFLADEAPEAFEKVVEELLASPHYGERWGRHWMDVARYADTAGESADYPIPQARLYRDYVIAAFNADKPYDQFLTEQIAGDLLPAATQEQRNEQVIATGFVALARRFGVDPDGAMHLTIEDTLHTLGQATMGLTLSCARCHDHKFDPIPMRDYYALYGIFQSTRYPFPGSENKKRQRDFVPLVPPEEFAKAMAPFKQKLAPLDQEMEALKAEREAIRQLELGEKPAIQPTKTREEIREAFRSLRAKRDRIQDQMPRFSDAYALSEAEKPSEARIHERGEPGNPGEIVPRGFLSLLGGQKLANPAQSGRAELAQWIVDPGNPLTARVIVNRIWQWHFGKPIVPTPNDFGHLGQPPTHPELLDWLAKRFVEEGWSIKKMHRRILLSAAYRQASSPAAPPECDPTNSLLSSFPRRRLDAEATRDALLSVSGQLDPTPGGEHPFPARETWDFTQHAPFHEDYDTNKRSVYLMQQRLYKHPFLAAFDGADANASTAIRLESTTPLQALFLTNNIFCHEQAQGFAVRIMAAEWTLPRRVQLAHRIAYGREATAAEIADAKEFIHGSTDSTHELVAWAAYCRVLLASNEFVYLD